VLPVAVAGIGSHSALMTRALEPVTNSPAAFEGTPVISVH
jgi:hypothetical protein